MAVLVDTSVMIDYLGGKDSGAARMFQRIPDDQVPYGINSFIYQETLQEVKSENDFAAVKEYLDTQTFYSLRDPRESFSAAAPYFLIGERFS
jgi:predicted nucleic acid-binding protein